MLQQFLTLPPEFKDVTDLRPIGTQWLATSQLFPRVVQKVRQTRPPA
jgi:hypothetical protein